MSGGEPDEDTDLQELVGREEAVSGRGDWLPDHRIDGGTIPLVLLIPTLIFGQCDDGGWRWHLAASLAPPWWTPEGKG